MIAVRTRDHRRVARLAIVRLPRLSLSLRFRHEPDSFLTEVFSVSALPESGSFHISRFLESPVFTGKNPSRRCP